MNWTGVVLAGGRSSRMGRDKALIELGGRTLLQRALDLLAPHVDDLLIIGDAVAHVDPLARTIPDERPGQGPLGGLVTALKHARHELVVVVACDMPGLTDAFIERIQLEMTHHADAIIPEHDGLIEPLAACYHRQCLAPFERSIVQEALKMSGALEQVRAYFVPIYPGAGDWPDDLFRNINAPGDL
jgi:molybdenum cofactor guanylyltransferase